MDLHYNIPVLEGFMQKRGVFSTSECSDDPLHTLNHISQIVLEEKCMFSSDSRDFFSYLAETHVLYFTKQKVRCAWWDLL